MCRRRPRTRPTCWAKSASFSLYWSILEETEKVRSRAPCAQACDFLLTALARLFPTRHQQRHRNICLNTLLVQLCAYEVSKPRPATAEYHACVPAVKAAKLWLVMKTVSVPGPSQPTMLHHTLRCFCLFVPCRHEELLVRQDDSLGFQMAPVMRLC